MGVAPAAIMFSRCDMVSDYPCRRSTVPLILRCRGLPARFRGPPFASAPSRATRKLAGGNIRENDPSDARCLTLRRSPPHLASRHRPTRLGRTSIAFGASVPEFERRDGYAHVLDVQELRQTQDPRPRPAILGAIVTFVLFTALSLTTGWPMGPRTKRRMGEAMHNAYQWEEAHFHIGSSLQRPHALSKRPLRPDERDQVRPRSHPIQRPTRRRSKRPQTRCSNLSHSRMRLTP